MNKYFIDFSYENTYNAGSKARDDISFFLKEKNYIPIILKKKKSKFKNIINIKSIFTTLNNIKNGSDVVIQYPFVKTKKYNKLILYFLRKKNCRCILLIHDISSLRFKLSNNKLKKEIQYFNKFNIVISHNTRMSEWLKRNNMSSSIIDLNLFDYIVCLDGIKENTTDNSIVFAGNLSENKSEFIYKLKNIENLKINLYGIGLNKSKCSKNMNYLGKYDANDLPNELRGKYGLLWDGASLDKCDGNFGEYLQYNNPHKFSLYLAANLPVIVWEKAAVSDFVIKNDIGITIKCLEEIPSIIDSISDKKYNSMKLNASKIGEKVRNGEYINNVLDKL